MPNKILRFVQTIQHLSYKQIFGQVFYRIGVRGWMFRRLPVLDFLPLSENLRFLPRDINNVAWLEAQKLEILGETFQLRELLETGFDPKATGIVLDTLSYLRYVPSFDISVDTYHKVLFYLSDFDNYCENNRYAKALSTTFNSVERVYALLKFVSICQSFMSSTDTNLLNSIIMKNVKSIYEDQEVRLGGNHYLRCLLCLSLVFDLSSGDTRTQKVGVKVSKKTLLELDYQFLSDGMHYEISPGYHRLMLLDILDYVQLCSDKNSLVKDYLVRKLPKYLAAMQFFDNSSDRLPQFNDNLPDAFPSVAEILRYAGELGFSPSEKYTHLPSAGLFSLRTNSLQMFFKAGPIGAHNQLAHAHSDNLSFELFDTEGWVCGNLPTLTYSSGPSRDMTRAEFGSSAPQLNDFFQAEHWGIFRVAKCSSDTQVSDNNSKLPHNTITAHHSYVNHKSTQLIERSFSAKTNYLEVRTNIKKNQCYKMHLFFDSSTDVSFISESEAMLFRRDGVIKILLDDCLFDTNISSIFCDLLKQEFRYIILRSVASSSSIEFSHH